MKNFILSSICIIAAASLIAQPSYAETSDQIANLQAQINELQKQLNALKTAQAQPVPSQASKAKPVAAPQPQTTQIQPQPVRTEQEEVKAAQDNKIIPDIRGVKITPGGFIEAATIMRSKNQTADMGSSFNTAIPFNNSVNAHQSEFRESARQSRLTLLAEGEPDEGTKLAAYFETDFLGTAPTANSVESNSYTPRLRQAYATYDNTDWGVHFLGGQAWSLLTMNQTGITPRKEDIPLTIEAQYAVGFNWTRNPQLRLVKDFDEKKINVGVSLESPQANLGGITVPPTVNATNPGGSTLSTANYSTDLAPDVISKIAFDPGWGHYEAFGIMRFFHDNVLSTFHNNTTVAGGGGLGVILPVIRDKLDLQGNLMAGEGIGRYGSAQLPDFAFAPDGSIHPLFEYTGLVGVVGHPDPTMDLYLYSGVEKVSRFNQANTAFGYGDFGLNNAGCDIAGGTCSAQTSSVWQITPGFWKQFYKGRMGMMKAGVQDSITRRNAFSDASGTAPHAYENIVMVSFRYYPF